MEIEQPLLRFLGQEGVIPSERSEVEEPAFCSSSLKSQLWSFEKCDHNGLVILKLRNQPRPSQRLSSSGSQ